MARYDCLLTFEVLFFTKNGQQGDNRKRDRRVVERCGFVIMEGHCKQ
jgi:hypothetical protein